MHVRTREGPHVHANPSNLAVGLELLRRSLQRQQGRTYAGWVGGWWGGVVAISSKCVNRKPLSRGASQKIDNDRSAH